MSDALGTFGEGCRVGGSNGNEETMGFVERLGIVDYIEWARMATCKHF